MNIQVILQYDGASSGAVVQRVKRLAAEVPEFAKVFVDLFESPDEAFQLDSVAVSTGEAYHLRVRLEPTDRLRELMAAFGAGKLD
ncbi:hypothetical protein [Cupriavidus oxalaticus]|uniref:Uncharacterized protein n=1 Tax=Cupriavidus oxalaticus TaxID=96344 RepID=A0A5P3VLU2_9BURK|nr:hypothetical protein [Cupriavidus oxalaticus]QEZ47207.1 hypothetical protein D2917_23955 [Cupriavidus oxalaticus]